MARAAFRRTNARLAGAVRAVGAMRARIRRQPDFARPRRSTRLGWQRLVAVPVLGGVVLGVTGALVIPGAATLLDGSETDDINVADRLSILPERSVVFAADGSELEKLGTQNRASIASLDQVPPVVINAVVAIEDQTFWDNVGVDLRAAARAFFANVDSGEVEQGGSTITQQLVKNRILTPERDLRRKVREANYAYQLNQEMSKDEILVAYLNTVYFGEGAYGIQTASERIRGQAARPARPRRRRPARRAHRPSGDDQPVRLSGSRARAPRRGARRHGRGGLCHQGRGRLRPPDPVHPVGLPPAGRAATR